VRKILLAVSIFLAGTSAARAQQDDVAAFFKGKTLRLIVGIGVGSGYDINARLLARHMAAHIPGQPTIVVQNQPGAGSLTMTNALYNTGPFDGTVMGASFNGMPTTPLLQPTGVRFDPVKLNWLGSTNRETQAMYVWHTAPAQVLEDIKGTEIVMGAQAPGSTQFDYPVLANRLFGFKFKVVTGYESTPKIHLAMESGEVHGTIANWSTQGDQRQLDRGEENPHPRAVGAAEESRAPRRAAVPGLRPERRRTGSAATDAGAAGIRPPVLSAAQCTGGAGRGAAAGIRRHHEGSRLPRRG
jgi:tripartite-type tricarboxylate transporter receptor subunit TctC